jgi:hypothetical protein
MWYLCEHFPELLRFPFQLPWIITWGTQMSHITYDNIPLLEKNEDFISDIGVYSY